MAYTKRLSFVFVRHSASCSHHERPFSHACSTSILSVTSLLARFCSLLEVQLLTRGPRVNQAPSPITGWQRARKAVLHWQTTELFHSRPWYIVFHARAVVLQRQMVVWLSSMAAIIAFKCVQEVCSRHLGYHFLLTCIYICPRA